MQIALPEKYELDGEGSKAGGQKPVRQKSVSQKPRYQNPLCTNSGGTNADMTQNPADDNCRLVQNPGIQMPVRPKIRDGTNAG